MLGRRGTPGGGIPIQSGSRPCAEVLDETAPSTGGTPVPSAETRVRRPNWSPGRRSVQWSQTHPDKLRLCSLVTVRRTNDRMASKSASGSTGCDCHTGVGARILRKNPSQETFGLQFVRDSLGADRRIGVWCWPRFVVSSSVSACRLTCHGFPWAYYRFAVTPPQARFVFGAAGRPRSGRTESSSLRDVAPRAVARPSRPCAEVLNETAPSTGGTPVPPA